jgi:DNA polymerase-3 subunit beta
VKLEVEKNTIESILIHLQPFLEKKDASQITSHIHFQSSYHTTTIQATDLEIGLSITTQDIDIQQEGSFTAHGKKFLDIVRILKEGKITFELKNDTLIIQQPHSTFKLPTFDPTTYPKFPLNKQKSQISLDAITLIQSLKKISPAIDNNNPKFELNGALINIKDEHTDIVGTDTRRLAVATIKKSNEKELSLIIPKKAITEIQKIFLNNITIFYDENYLIIKNETYFFFTRLISGKFPNYERIIPSSTKYQIELPKKTTLDALKMITTIAQEIKITFEPHRLLFQSLSVDSIEAKTEMLLNTQLSTPFSIAFNSKYLLNFITQSENETFLLAFNEPSLPFMVKDQNFITIIMPITI